MSEQKKVYAPITDDNCHSCNYPKNRLEFVELESDENAFDGFDDNQIVDLLMKGLHSGVFRCKKCDEKQTRWVQYRKPYPDYVNYFGSWGINNEIE